MSMLRRDDPLFTDKLFCMLHRYRYIILNEFDPGTKARMALLVLEARGRDGTKCSCTDLAGQSRCGVGGTCRLRANSFECDAACGDTCQNQILTSGLRPNFLYIDCVVGYGKCVKTSKLIPSGSPIIEYTGQVQFGKVHYEQLWAYPFHKFNNDVDMFINSRKKGNESRLIHPSLHPNCEMTEIIVKDEIRMLVVACMDIPAKQILTMKYPQRDDTCVVFASKDIPAAQVVTIRHPRDELDITRRLRDIDLANDFPVDKEPILPKFKLPPPPQLEHWDEGGNVNDQGTTCQITRCNFRYQTDKEWFDHFKIAHAPNAFSPNEFFSKVCTIL